MKAPNKLYFDGKSSACERPIFSSRNIEYIRKDALMEWVKTEFTDITERLKAQDDPVWWGQRNAFQQVVDKINSL